MGAVREINLINRELREMRNFFGEVVQIIPKFRLTSRRILPYGLKPHTRSVSWIVEQVIAQQAKYNRRTLGVNDVEIDLPDTCLHDCEVVKNSRKKYYVNIKITNVKVRPSKSDIAAVEKLYMQYKANPDYRLIYVVFGFSFSNITVSLDRSAVHVFSPQFLPIYVNPRNDKLQAHYRSARQVRSRSEFLNLLQKESRSIVLT